MLSLESIVKTELSLSVLTRVTTSPMLESIVKTELSLSEDVNPELTY